MAVGPLNTHVVHEEVRRLVAVAVIRNHGADLDCPVTPTGLSVNSFYREARI